MSQREYTGEDCEHCGRCRVETDGKRRICEKCHWDQDAHDYAEDRFGFTIWDEEQP